MMNRNAMLTLTLILLIGGVADAAAYHRGGSRFDFYFGGGPMWWGPRYYWPDPYFYQPRTIVIEREPPVYIQRPQAVIQQPAAAPPAPASIWYYCPAPAGYYPYVQNCNSPWVNVDPRTVAPPPGQ